MKKKKRLKNYIKKQSNVTHKIINNYYIIANKVINCYNILIHKSSPNSYLRLPVILDKLVIKVNSPTEKGFYSQLLHCNNKLINYLSEQEVNCFNKFVNSNSVSHLNLIREFHTKGDFKSPLGGLDDKHSLDQLGLLIDNSQFKEENGSIPPEKLKNIFKDITRRIFYPTSLVNFVYYPAQSLQIIHTGEHFQRISTSDYMISMAHGLNKAPLNLENVQLKRLDLAIDLVINSDDADFIQHFIYAYLIKRIHIPCFKKDKINFINFDSTVNDISDLNVNNFRGANGLIDPFTIKNENKDIINNTNLITGFYIGNIKSRYHNSSICVYYKHIQEGSLKKKIRFELRFKNKKATDIYFEVLNRLRNSNYNYEEVSNFVFHREFKSLVSVKKYPKVHKKSVDGSIKENKQLYRVKKEASWFTQLCDSFLGR